MDYRDALFWVCGLRTPNYRHMQCRKAERPQAASWLDPHLLPQHVTLLRQYAQKAYRNHNTKICFPAAIAFTSCCHNGKLILGGSLFSFAAHSPLPLSGERGR